MKNQKLKLDILFGTFIFSLIGIGVCIEQERYFLVAILTVLALFVWGVHDYLYVNFLIDKFNRGKIL